MYNTKKMLMMVISDRQLINELSANGYSSRQEDYINLLKSEKLNHKFVFELRQMFKRHKDNPEFMEKYNLLVIPELRPEPTANRVCILVAGGIVQEVYASEPLDCFVTDLDIEGTDNPEEWNTIIEGTHKIL